MSKELPIARRALPAIALLAACVMAPGAFASSDDAWTEFRKAVETACLKAAAPQLTGAKATVDPFGSNSFGLALVRGKPKGGTQTVTMICVYDKVKNTVELGSELKMP